MFSLQGLDHLVIRARDLSRMIAFYRDVLGCTVDHRRDELGLVHLRAGRSMIDLISVDGPLGRRGGAAAGSEARNMDHLCLRIEPFAIDDLRAHLGAHGVEPSGVLRNYGADGNGPSIYLQDPEGNTIELKGPPDDAR
jgi:catechol 2,3-dioxygenase-like lactoylglutathione lyase family enzyme